MRPFIVVGVLGTVLSVGLAEAQTSASSKRHSDKRASDAFFENGPEVPNALAEARRAESTRAPQADRAKDSAPLAQAAPATPALVTVQAVPPGPPQKKLTGAEFALVAVGSKEKEVLEVLGPPASRLVVPDDDGHLRETFQYWANGRLLGTVRLDNGNVIQIDSKL